ncbi:hypothetical protein [Nocardia pneumoniae]|uniref:hypothetical protein n=1 Tax=Nocardia pneumoniae TaxID=228601 RepID=UPI0012F69E91|nr:hypothetical protein [Nocardia pneumoniae]
MPVFVVRLDYDFWYEVAREEGTLAADEEPFLDSAGHAYYIQYPQMPHNGRLGTRRSPIAGAIPCFNSVLLAVVPRLATWWSHNGGKRHKRPILPPGARSPESPSGAVGVYGQRLVSFAVLRNDAAFWPDSGPHRSLDEARITAEICGGCGWCRPVVIFGLIVLFS